MFTLIIFRLKFLHPRIFTSEIKKKCGRSPHLVQFRLKLEEGRQVASQKSTKLIEMNLSPSKSMCEQCKKRDLESKEKAD